MKLALGLLLLTLPGFFAARRIRGVPPAKDDQVSAAMKMVSAALAKQPQAAEDTHVPSALTKRGNHSVLDVGFSTFEAEVARLGAEDLQRLNATGNLTEQSRKAAAIAFREAFRSVKQEVANAWMELKPEKRDLFVMKVREKFEGLFKEGEVSISKALDSHLKLLFAASPKVRAVKGDPVELLTRALKSPLKLMGSRLHDYEDLIYMSNIFLKFREKRRRTKELSALEDSAAVWVQ